MTEDEKIRSAMASELAVEYTEVHFGESNDEAWRRMADAALRGIEKAGYLLVARGCFP